VIPVAGVGVAAAGALVAVPSLYLDVLALAALRYRPAPAGDAAGAARLTVLIPAHDEEELIGGCVRTLFAQTYPRDRFDVVVVADNCSDGTAAAAGRAGARVLVRHDPEHRGKGAALRFAIDRLLTEPEPPDAIVVVDADSAADTRFLQALVRPLQHGARVVQGESLLIDDGSPGGALRSAAFLLVNRVRPAGRAVLGLRGRLAGNGMLIARDVLEAHPWEAYTSAEDLEYSLMLHRAGVEVAFGGGAMLLSPGPPTADAAEQQRLRWEGGLLHLARTHVPALIAAAARERRPDLLGTALDLSVPPLALLTIAAGGGLVVTAGLTATALPWWAVLPWAVAAAGVPAFVLVGLHAAHADASSYRALRHAPRFALAKARRTPALLRFRAETWVRTQRAHEAGGSRL
jgi:cellulose synthase/poly-beta-1,6-N-acetylglucosamine synthase-like glycosyltransferase